MSPECLAFSVARRPAWRHLKGTNLTDPEAAGLRFMSLCVRVAEYQMRRGRGFLLEHPEGASSWELDSVREILGRPGVLSGVADLCQYGLAVKGGEPKKKPTRFMTNRASILQPLLLRCDGNHSHRQLCGKALTRAAQTYPPGLVQAMSEGILESARAVALGHQEETLWSGVWADPAWLAERGVTGLPGIPLPGPVDRLERSFPAQGDLDSDEEPEEDEGEGGTGSGERGGIFAQ